MLFYFHHCTYDNNGIFQFFFLFFFFFRFLSSGCVTPYVLAYVIRLLRFTGTCGRVITVRNDLSMDRALFDGSVGHFNVYRYDWTIIYFSSVTQKVFLLTWLLTTHRDHSPTPMSFTKLMIFLPYRNNIVTT